MEAVAEVVVEGDLPEKENVGEIVPRVRLIVIEPAVIDIEAETVKVPVGWSDTVQLPDPDGVGFDSLNVEVKEDVGVGGGVTVLENVALTSSVSDGEF